MQHAGSGTSLFYPSLKKFPSHMRDPVLKVASSQSAIGWDNALKGYVSKDWTELAARKKTEINLSCCRKSVAKGVRLARVGTILCGIVATAIANPGNGVFTRSQSTLVGIAFHSWLAA